MQCELCGADHPGTYGSGRFCATKCARAFSTKIKRSEINTIVSQKLKRPAAICEKCGKSFLWASHLQRHFIRCVNKAPKAHKVPRVPWEEQFPLEEVMCENSTYRRASLKARLLSTGLLECVCAICGSPAEWRGQPMPLILDHVNGVNNDNRLENLRLVCSNCDSQLPTYKSKNRQNKSKRVMEE